MTRKVDPLGDELEKLATTIAKEANSADVAIADRLDCMKILTGYYAATRKLKGKLADDDPDIPSFGNIRDKIKAVK